MIRAVNSLFAILKETLLFRLTFVTYMLINTVKIMYTVCTGKLLNYSMLYLYQLKRKSYIYVGENYHHNHIWLGYPSVLHQTGWKIISV